MVLWWFCSAILISGGDVAKGMRGPDRALDPPHPPNPPPTFTIRSASRNFNRPSRRVSREERMEGEAWEGRFVAWRCRVQNADKDVAAAPRNVPPTDCPPRRFLCITWDESKMQHTRIGTPAQSAQSDQRASQSGQSRSSLTSPLSLSLLSSLPIAPSGRADQARSPGEKGSADCSTGLTWYRTCLNSRCRSSSPPPPLLCSGYVILRVPPSLLLSPHPLSCLLPFSLPLPPY